MLILQQVKTKIAAVKDLPWGRWLVYALIGLGVVAGLVFVFNRFWPEKPIVSIPTVLPEAKEAVKIEKIYIPGPVRIVVYDRDALTGKVPIPPEVAKDKNNQFTSTAEIPKAPWGGTAVGFTNMTTGKSAISFTPKERPLFGFGGKTSVGTLGGISTKGNVAIGYVGQDILRVGPVNLGVAGGGGMIGVDALLGGVIHLHGEF